MRKIKSYVVEFVFLLILSISSVRAVECDDLVMYARSDFWQSTGIKMNYNYGGWNSFHLYTLKNSNGAAFSAYCRNAGVSAGKEYEGQMLYCDHTIFDAQSDNETIKIYDAGIVEILKEGYSTISNNGNLSSNQEYTATNIALRVYEMLWPDLNTNGVNDYTTNNAHKYFVNKWLDDTSIQKLLKQTVGYVRSKFTDAVTVSTLTDENGDNVTDAVIKEAKSLVKKGLKAAKYYKTNGAASITGLDDEPLKQKYTVTTDENDNKTYKTSFTYTLNASGFKSENAYIKLKFNCANCSEYGVSYKFYINGTNVGKKISSQNLVEYLTNGSGTLEIKVLFTAVSTDYNCETLDYTLDFEWFDDTISVDAFDMYSASCSKNTECQHFYMLYATDVSTKYTIEDSVELCNASCTELERSCANGNESACKQFEKKFKSSCADCTTYVGNATCSENDSTITISEGYDIDTSNCSNISDSNLNVLQCIINNQDVANNSYEATKVLSNDYCRVYCKEDYRITLPGIKNVNSGRYFSLEASISGTKTCYTSLINEDNNFKSDLYTARKAVIDAWNEWNKWNKGVNVCKNNSGYATWNYTIYDYNGNTKSQSYTYTINGVSASCGNNADSELIVGSAESITSAIKDLRTQAKNTLKSKINSYVEIINAYNACSGKDTIKYNIKLNTSTVDGWAMDYDYEPIISFTYEESYMNSLITNQLETDGKSNISEVTQSLCTSGVNKSYTTCSSGWKTKTDNTNTLSQFVCKQNGSTFTCGTENIIVSSAKYVKQVMTASANYITPTQFYTIYPTGAIVAASAGNENNITNSSELTNKLPVGLGTAQGVYTYALNITNLGEYYNSTKLGRIWGKSNSVVVNILNDVANGESCTSDGSLVTSTNVNGSTIKNGVYVCAYRVNYPTDDDDGGNNNDSGCPKNDCTVECDENGCKNPSCSKNDCPVECDNCIYTNGATNVSYKPISSGNINPNNREMGKNWNYNENSISTALELKAYATTKEIEDTGEKIYDENVNSASSNGEFLLEVTLDSGLINKIKNYNDKYENDGGYANNTLKCYDYVLDGVTYDNIYCYSTFIDELLYDNSTKNKITVSDKRIISTNETSTDKLRKSKTQSSGYWTTWTEANSSKWSVTTEKGIAYYKSNYSEIGIGPSWK